MKPEKKLYQWDVNQYLIELQPTAEFVDYPIGNEVIRLETDGTRCRIPDEVLQTYGGKTCYERYPDGTYRAYSFSVLYAPKPPDYVYTPEERTTFEALTARVDAAIDEIKRRADSGEFTPKKGVDYFTDAEKAEMMESVSSGAVGEFRKVVDSADAIKTALETVISNSGTAKTQLESAVSTAGTSKTNLETAIANAGTAQTNLETVIRTANSIYTQLSTENANANANLDALMDENFNAQEILAGVTDIRAYLGMIETEDVLGLCVDYKNKTFTRLAGAVGLSAGADFDAFGMYGGRKKCNVLDNGTISAYYGDADYAEDGSNGQVMVYQPKFYYLVTPLEYDPIDTGIGYHLRKANYYITTKKRTGFKLHPAFYDASGNEVDYILIGAYEGSLYDTSEGAYITDDAQVMNASEDLFCSIAGVHPASGLTQNLTRPNIETMCKNRGTGFHSLGIKAMSAEQMLMMIELGTLNFQSAIGNGVTSITDNSAYSCASYTGSTASIGNGTGMASSTNDYTGTAQTGNGKTSICYRGVENHWGNIYKFVYGVNIFGNGAIGGGQPFICKDFNYAESKNSDNYEGAGFTVTNANGYINAMGYSTKCDWLFMPSEIGGNSSLPVGDYAYVTPDLNAYRIALLGGNWYSSLYAGGFYWSLDYGAGYRARSLGGRLLYVPTANI